MASDEATKENLTPTVSGSQDFSFPGVLKVRSRSSGQEQERPEMSTRQQQDASFPRKLGGTSACVSLVPPASCSSSYHLRAGEDYIVAGRHLPVGPGGAERKMVGLAGILVGITPWV